MALAGQSCGVELLCAERTQWESSAALGFMQLKTVFLTQTINSASMRGFHSPLGEIHRCCGSRCRRKQDGAILTTVTSVTRESWQACDNGKVKEATRQQVMENHCNYFCVIPEGEMSLAVCL